MTADIPTYSVFRKGEDKTYAYNASETDRIVTFSDGYSMTVPAGETYTESTQQFNPNAPVVLLNADKTSGKSPLSINFKASNSFDRNDLATIFDWTFGSLGSSSKADTTFTFYETGDYTVNLSATNSNGLVSEDSIIARVLPNGTPYGELPQTSRVLLKRNITITEVKVLHIMM